MTFFFSSTNDVSSTTRTAIGDHVCRTSASIVRVALLGQAMTTVGVAAIAVHVRGCGGVGISVLSEWLFQHP